MPRRYFLPLLFLLPTTVVGVPDAHARDRWIHVAVNENHGRGDQVRISVPFDLVETVLPFVHKGNMHCGRVRLEGLECDASDLRAIWSAVKNRKDDEFVTVQDDGETVRVAKKNGYLLVRSDGKGRKESGVDVRVPLPVVDALLSGDGEELDVAAAIRAMGRQGSGDLVVVDDDDTSIRIWVDAKRSSD